MLRNRGNRLPSERAALSISLRRPGRACRLSPSRSISLSADLSVSLVRSFVRLLLRSTVRPASRTSLILLLFSSVARGGGESQDERFPPSLGILPIVFIVLWTLLLHHHLLFSRSPSSVVGNRRYRCSTRTHTHTHTMPRPAHIVPAENRAFFRARPRFLADFIPIPRNKLADDHGGICLLSDLSSPSLPPS